MDQFTHSFLYQYRHFSWLNYELVLLSRKSLQVKDINNELVEKLEFPERVIQVVIRYKKIVVATPTQCYIYGISNFNTPQIMELKDGSVSVILLTEK